VKDHINYRKNDRWRSYRFYRALQRLKSPMRYICEIFGAPRFSSFSTQSAKGGHPAILVNKIKPTSSLVSRAEIGGLAKGILVVQKALGHIALDPAWQDGNGGDATPR
jgi:hypothetical protein